MPPYSIDFRPSAREALASLPRNLLLRIGTAISHLAEDPRPHRSKRLSGQYNVWHIRISDYRVLYTIEDDRLVVPVLKVGHRREVYR